MNAAYLGSIVACVIAGAAHVGCSASSGAEFGDRKTTGSNGGASADGAGGGLNLGGNFGSGGGCGIQCSADLHAVIDCHGNLIEQCTGAQGCDQTLGTCTDACEAAVNNKQSVGCEYYATDMEMYPSAGQYCFAAIVANTWNENAHIDVSYQGQALPLDQFARIPVGQGQGLTYSTFDAVTGLPPGEVAILFLAGGAGAAPLCPVSPPIANADVSGTTIGASFRIQTDVPVVAYQINPYGGGTTAVTAASLLLPTSAWGTNYIAVQAYQYDLYGPSMNIVAAEDGTEVTINPITAVVGGSGIPASPANTPFSFMLNAGQQAQLSQQAELTGSVIQSTKPVGLMAGQPCMRTPVGVAYCDHGEQMIPPVQALGSEYVGVMHKPRAGEPSIWRLVGALDGTQLSWSPAPPAGAPTALSQGQVVEFITSDPFVVQSQDSDHPFVLLSYMTGSQYSALSDKSGLGDVDFVTSVPPDQYMRGYVFFADPTYPDTHLVVVRRALGGEFKDVNLDCAGALTGWQAVGDYEWTRFDLNTGFQNNGNCSTGRREISSDAPFGLWVWGWGTPFTSPSTQNVSYGYPGGMNVQPINEVVIPPTPR